MGKDNSEGEELGSLIGGITEHDSLVSSTELLQSGIVVKTLSDIGGLLLNGDQDIAGLVVETLGGVIVADVLDSTTDDLLVVKAGLGGDFTKDHDHTSLGGGLASDLKGPESSGFLNLEADKGVEFYLGERVLGQASIENGVGNLVTERGDIQSVFRGLRNSDCGHIRDLVGVTLSDGLGGEKESSLVLGSSHFVDFSVGRR
jgi:hypothetical protein